MRIESKPSPGTALSTETTNPAAGPAAYAVPATSPVDHYWLRWLTRCVWLGVLGASAGAAGTYFWLKQPPLDYRSASMIQVKREGEKSPSPDSQTDASTSALGDEIYVIRSEHVLRTAAENQKLDATPTFQGQTANQIAAELNDSPALVIEPASVQPETTVIRIQYDSPDATTAQQVVGGIVESYSQFTREEFKRGDDKLLSQILAARDEAFTRLQDLEKAHDKFMKETDLVFVDGEPKSIHRKIADRFLTQREELMVEKSQIESRIRSAEMSRDDSDPRTVMLTLRSDKETASDVIDQNMTRQLERLQNELRDRASVRTRETQLLPLVLERDDLLQKFGKKYPQVVALQKQIDVVEKQVARMEKEEKEKEELIKKVMSIGGKPEVDLDPEAEIRKRVDLAIEALKQQLASVEQQLKAVNESYELESANAKKEIEAIRESQRFDRDIERQRELYEKVLARLDDADLLSQDEGIVVTVLDSPSEGKAVDRPLLNQSLFGGLIGLASGIVLAMMFPPRQRALGVAAETAGHVTLPGMPAPDTPATGMPAPVLGNVPRLTSSDVVTPSAGMLEYTPIDPTLCTVSAPYGKAAEGFNALRSTLLSSQSDAGHQIVQFTSGSPGVGKSTVVANLAVSVARTGKRVLLIDADLRRPRIQGLFGLNEDRGLGWVLEQASQMPGRDAVPDLVQTAIAPGPVANLSIMAAGTTRANPSELLSSNPMSFILEATRKMYDVILIDSPPVLAVSDSLDLAQRVDGLAVVVKSDPNDAEQATRVTNVLATVNANVIGVIVNAVDDPTQERSDYRVYPAAHELHLGNTGKPPGSQDE